MNALYDHNLPPSLVSRLSDILPDSEHVRNVGMAEADDIEILEFARQHGLAIFSKDSDFQILATLKGHPPKSVRVGAGNASVAEIKRSRDHRIHQAPYAKNPQFRIGS
jgi:predicted nuclease of predicted toxin-antitoxin system